MTPEQWQQIKDVLNQALELEPADRGGFLDRACAGDSSLRKEVEALLAADEAVGTEFLDEPQAVELRVAANLVAVKLDGSPVQSEDAWIGRRVGPYKIVEQIGVGGMGEVYRAFRADDQYKKQVAFKVVRGGQDSAFVVGRFKNERQILASLDHPNIARLHDGGTTEDGVPYFVMELIDGQPIDQYCAKHGLSLTERLNLFLQVCAAVQYAHQRLIIHRDIKPGNILVAADGTPKLLDFGIAKILDTEAIVEGFEPTLTVFRVLTPGYASPEQVKGEPITTASDVYSLGVVLYELLTGQHPYRSANSTPQEIARAVCEVEPERPSAVVQRNDRNQDRDKGLNNETTTKLRDDSQSSSDSTNAALAISAEERRKTLRGDLDNIVLMALRKDPKRRYSSVEQFAEDIRRHLGNLPVIARQDTVRYRTSKFISRHRAGVVAAAVVLVTLLAAMVITVRQAQIARQERTRAEQRFNDVRTLANSLIFEIHDSIQNLPGATAPRKLLLDRALQYLDSLAKESSGDASLQRELAAGYLRIGNLQGSTLDASLGQPKDALSSFKKALAIREAVAKANPLNAEDQLNLAIAHRALARMLDSAGEEGSRPHADQALAITDRLAASGIANADLRGERSIEYQMLSDLQDGSGDQVGSLDSMKKSLALRLDLLKENPQDRAQQRGAAVSYVKVANALAALGSRAEALQFYQSGLEVFESLAKDPADARVRRELAVATIFRAGTLRIDGDAAGALAANQRAFTILHAMAQTDPQNATLQLDDAGGNAGIGIDLVILGREAEGEARLRKAIQLYQEILAHNRTDQQAPHYIGTSEIWLGEGLAKGGNLQAAVDSYQKAIANLDAPNDDPDMRAEAAIAHTRLGQALARLGRTEEATAAYRKALAIAEPLAKAKPPNTQALYAIADAYFDVGELSRMEAAKIPPGSASSNQQWTEARDWYSKSADAWNKIPNPAALTPGALPCGNPKAVAQAMAQSDAVLAHLAPAHQSPATVPRDGR
jgi:non-specific serine/threonine protein kinase/serine/threonine-protein kinase